MLDILFIGTEDTYLKDIEDKLKSMFKDVKFGFTYISAELVKFRNNNLPDIVFLDYNENEGIYKRFCKQLKAESFVDYLPIVLLSNSNMAVKKQTESMPTAADFFIQKPINKTELFSVMQAILQLKNIENRFKDKNKELRDRFHQKEMELNRQEKRYSDMFDEASNIIVLIDKKHIIREWNKAAEKIFEIDKDKAIGENFEKIFTNKIMRFSIKQKFLKDKDCKVKNEYQVNNKTSSGKKYQILWSVNELDDEYGELGYILAIGQNVTERVKEERERKKAEAKLKNGFKFLYDLINVLPSPVFYKNTKGEYLGCNTYFAELYGLTPSQIVGKKAEDINTKEIGDIITEDDIKIYATNDAVSREMSMLLHNGEIHKFILKKISFTDFAGADGIAGILFDITQQTQMEEKLGNSELFYKSIIDSVNDAIILVHTDSRINFWNKAAEQLFGYSKDEIYNKILCQILNRSEVNFQEIVAGLIENVDKSNPANFIEFEVIDKSGRKFSAEFSLSLLELNDETFVVIVAKDVSIRKNIETNLLLAKEKAEEADRLKSAFLSNMSHEIRTPMNAIVGFAQLLGNPVFSEHKKQVFIEQINQNSESLLQLIDDIIYISKIEAGKITISKNQCFINQELKDIHTSFIEHKRRMNKEHVELILDTSIKDNAFAIETDIQKIKQVLTNLLSNALKFTEKGSVTFGYKLQNKNELLFFVKDTGLGINKNKIKYVFDRFTKVSAEKTKLYGGTGIGLSICKNLVEKLGGSIWVESVENKGSTFYFIIPFEEEELQNINNTITENNSDDTIIDLSNATILIAEDEMVNYLYLEELLSITNVKIIWAKNGKEVVNYVDNNSNINIVLMDMKMPIMDGYDATIKLKKIRPKLPVIAQTAYALPDELELAFSAGCDAYISKPIDAKELMDVVTKYIR